MGVRGQEESGAHCIVWRKGEKGGCEGERRCGALSDGPEEPAGTGCRLQCRAWWYRQVIRSDRKEGRSDGSRSGERGDAGWEQAVSF